MTIRFVANGKCTKCAEFGQFNIDDGMIRNPGKFEAESEYIVHFYHAMMDGFGEMCACGAADWFTVDQSDVDLFPELADSLGEQVHIGNSELGFAFIVIAPAEERAYHEEHASNVAGYGD